MFSKPANLESESEKEPKRFRPPRAALSDFAFLTALHAISACVFLTQRGKDWIHNAPSLLLAAIIWLIVAARWSCLRSSPDNEHSESLRTTPSKNWLLRLALVWFSLLAFTLIAFTYPLALNFWHGYDDSDFLYKSTDSIFRQMAIFDSYSNRCATHVYSKLATSLTGDSLDGFLYLGTAIKWASAISLYSLLSMLFPKQRSLHLMAALLLIANPAEPLRYMIVAMGNYYFTPFRLLLSITLFLYSYLSENRWLLIIALVVLNTCVLTNEPGFLQLAAAPTLLLLAAKPRRPHFWLWTYAWLGTVAIGACRLVAFLLGKPDSYQIGAATKHPITIDSLWRRIEPSFSSFPIVGWNEFWAYGVAVAIMVLIILVLSGKGTIFPTGRRSYYAGLLVSAVAILLGVAPFCTLGGNARTQFFALPAQATFWALTIAFAASFAPKVARLWLEISLCTILVSIAAVGSMHHQTTTNESNRFEKVVRIFEGIRSETPRLKPGTLIVLLLPNGVKSPFGANYALHRLCRIEFAVNGIQTGDDYKDAIREEARFDHDGVLVPSGYAEPVAEVHTPNNGPKPACVGYERLVIFSLDQKGDVSLLYKLPESMVPEGALVARYNPGARILSGTAPVRFRFTHLSDWMPRFRPQ